MKNLIHVSANQFSSIDEAGHTAKIWDELATGFDNYFILARSKRNKLEYYRKNNINLILIPKLLDSSISFFFTSFVVFWYIKKERISYILCQDPFAGGLACVFASKLYRVPLMMEIHTDVYFKYFTEKKIGYFLLKSFFKFLLSQSTKVRSLSTTMTLLLSDKTNKNNIVLIPNRVNTELFSPPKLNYNLSQEITITSVGRFVDQKGFDLAINVVQSLSLTYKVKLILIGGGKLHNYFNKLIGQNNNIILIKWISQLELISVLRATDIYIQPSKPYLGEAMPRTILEAMAIGLPIISTNICAIPGVLNSENSILISPNSHIELRNAIINLIENYSLRKRIGEKAHVDVKNKYDWDMIFNLYKNEIIRMNYNSNFI